MALGSCSINRVRCGLARLASRQDQGMLLLNLHMMMRVKAYDDDPVGNNSNLEMKKLI